MAMKNATIVAMIPTTTRGVNIVPPHFLIKRK